MDRKVKIERLFPDVLQPAREFQDIANSENPEFDLLYQNMKKWFRNGFALDIDIDGAVRWEKMLGIIPLKSDGLEERKNRILSRIQAMSPYTHRTLETMLSGRFGAGMVLFKLQYDEYSLVAEIDRSLKKSLYKVFCFFRAIIPANLGILLQNTEKIDQTIYFSGMVRQFKKSTIQAASGFDMTEASGTSNFGGLVRQFKKSILKAGE